MERNVIIQVPPASPYETYEQQLDKGILDKICQIPTYLYDHIKNKSVNHGVTLEIVRNLTKNMFGFLKRKPSKPERLEIISRFLMSNEHFCEEVILKF